MTTEHHSAPSRDGMISFDERTGGIVVSPKASFIVGLVGGVMALCTIGFVVLLCMMLRGSSFGGSAYVPTPSPSVADAGAGAVPAGEQVGEVVPVSNDDHIRGDKNAAVTLVEYSDFECPFCARFHPTMQQLMNDPEFKGKVRWVYRHYPLSFHPQATPAANASECAAEQGKFWEYADELIVQQASLSDAVYGQIAGKLGLNRSKFDSCYSSKKYQARITADQAGATTAGVTGTPGTIIIGKDGSKQLVPGAVPYETLKQMVQSAI